jgi:hypothetical protein
VSGKKIEEVLLDEDLSPLERLRLINTAAYNKKIAEDLDKSPLVSQLVTPDQRFLMKRLALCEDADKTTDQRRALVELLRDHQRLGVPLSQYTLDLAAAELERAWWPDKDAKKCWRHVAEVMLQHMALEATEAWYRRRGDENPRDKAKKEVAKYFRHNSGEALLKFLQPNRSRVHVIDVFNRMNSKPRRTPCG